MPQALCGPRGLEFGVKPANTFPVDVAALASAIPAGGHWTKPVKPIPSRKTDKKVPLADCFQAPCRSSCPIEQDRGRR